MPDRVRHDGEGQNAGDDEDAALFGRLGLRGTEAECRLAEAAK